MRTWEWWVPSAAHGLLGAGRRASELAVVVDDGTSDGLVLCRRHVVPLGLFQSLLSLLRRASGTLVAVVVIGDVAINH